MLSIHLVLSDRTRGLFGAAELALMKPTAVLINTSRGPIVDEHALIEALRERRIAGAGLDVFDREPLPPGHELTTLENTVLLPHLGYVTEEHVPLDVRSRRSRTSPRTCEAADPAGRLTSRLPRRPSRGLTRGRYTAAERRWAGVSTL